MHLAAVEEAHAERPLEQLAVGLDRSRVIVGEATEVEARVRALRAAAAPGGEQRARPVELDRDVLAAGAERRGQWRQGAHSAGSLAACVAPEPPSRSSCHGQSATPRGPLRSTSPAPPRGLLACGERL